MKGVMMRKTSIPLSAIILIVSVSGLNAEPWKKSLDTDFTLTQNAYSDSWTGGEAGNISWVWNANGVFEKQMSPKFNFKNTSKLSFGQTHIQDKDTKDWASPQKSTDLIDIENVGKFTMGWVVDPYVALRIESQFVDASDTIANKNLYLNPMRFTESAGASRQFYKTEKNELLSRLGLAIRQNMVKWVEGQDGDTDSEITNDGGLESVTDLKLTMSETLNFTSKLTLYKAFFFSKSDDDPEDNWKAVDVNWENRVSASVAKYVTVSLYTQLLYDKEIDVRGRFKQTLAMGITYKLY
ncbi:MAG: DUF481 domain-containing protein [candidate division Zixibacteria bacterium]|nr:DUF481 domain-containing protein [candidate division Zixibacteria bacterium]